MGRYQRAPYPDVSTGNSCPWDTTHRGHLFAVSAPAWARACEMPAAAAPVAGQQVAAPMPDQAWRAPPGTVQGAARGRDPASPLSAAITRGKLVVREIDREHGSTIALIIRRGRVKNFDLPPASVSPVTSALAKAHQIPARRAPVADMRPWKTWANGQSLSW
jgi:hypothetical protein